MNRRKFTQAAIATLLVPTLCASTLAAQSYKEEICSILMSEDGKKLIVATEKYHYIFDAPPVLMSALKGPLHKSLSASFSMFSVSANDMISGVVTITLPKSTEEVLQTASNAGFTRNSEGGAFYSTRLRGERFSSGGIVIPDNYRLNQKYVIEIDTSATKAEHFSKVTPLSIVAGVVFILAIPVFIAVLMVHCAINGTLSNCHE